MFYPFYQVTDYSPVTVIILYLCSAYSSDMRIINAHNDDDDVIGINFLVIVAGHGEHITQVGIRGGKS